MPEYLAPGVYVEETSFRSKSIEGVSTTTTAFVGPTRYGPHDRTPDILTSLAEYERVHGDGEPLRFGVGETPNFMWHAVRAFFENGGRRLYAVRVLGEGPCRAHGPGTEVPAVTVVTGAAGNQNFEHTVPGAIRPGTVRLRGPGAAGAREFMDDSAGQLIGQGGAAGVRGTVDYDAGYLTITFEVAPADGEVWTLTHHKVDVVARFVGAAGNGRLKFTPRAGQPLDFTVNELPTSTEASKNVAVGDIVEVLRKDEAPQWRQVEGAPGAYTLASLQAGEAAIPLDSKVLRMARAASVSVSFQRTGQHESAGIWEGLAPTSEAIVAFFAAVPRTDEQARTLPVVVHSISPAVLHGGGITLTDGSDGAQPDGTDYEGREDPYTDVRTGLKGLEDAEEISIIAAPGLAGLDDLEQAAAGVHALRAHADRMRYRIVIVDSPAEQSISDVRQYRARFESTRMALYYPWVKILDPISRREINLPPSGFIAGIYARNDINRAVYKAPANEVVSLALGFERTLNQSHQEVLNPEGINCLRFFEGRGMRVWGARTLAADPEWKYVNVRRYFAYLERSIDRGTQWAVFEPNGPALWNNVRNTILDFLNNEFQSGALLGAKPEQAFFVRCDRSTMTQNDLDNGRLICLVGVAPLKPAEFVVFRVGQWTADAKS
jgi:phage tail sheath protein FI